MSSRRGTVGGLSAASPIEDVLDVVIVALNLNALGRDEVASLRRRWSDVFRANLILTYGHLLQIPPHYLPRLQLPLLFEAELERLLLGSVRSMGFGGVSCVLVVFSILLLLIIMGCILISFVLVSIR